MLADLVALDVFNFLLVFTRLGAAMMLMPGFGSNLVSPRFRLIIALGLTVAVTPVLAPGLPPMPQAVAELVRLLALEVTVGLFLGILVQTMLTALNLAGTFMGFQAGLANALTTDPVTEQQSTILPGFLANVALVLIFATDMHHLMLRAAVDSYAVFAPGAPLPTGDIADKLARTLGESFALGLQLAGPVMIFGIVLNTGLGLMSRLMPTMQVYFVAMPLQVGIGLMILAGTLPAMMLWFLRYLEEGLLAFGGMK